MDDDNPPTNTLYSKGVGKNGIFLYILYIRSVQDILMHIAYTICPRVMCNFHIRYRRVSNVKPGTGSGPALDRTTGVDTRIQFGLELDKDPVFS